LFWKASSAEAARRTASHEVADLRKQVQSFEEERQAWEFEKRVLIQSYRALSRFTIDTLVGRLDHVPEVQRGLAHLHRILRKYR
jgi:hypothetical protein